MGNDSDNPGDAGEDHVEERPPKLDFLFVAGILVGLAMTGFGFFLQSSDTISARLIMVCGLGVVLGAFGSTATIKYKAYVVGGAAAIALILGYFLDYIDKGQQKNFLLVQVDGIPEEARFEIFSDRNLYGAELDRAYEFVVMEQHLSSRHLGAVLSIGDDGEAAESASIELNCIKKLELKPHFKKKQTIYWSYDHQNQALFNDKGVKISKQGSCRINTARNTDVETESPPVTGYLGNIFSINTAFAAGLQDIKRYTRQLKSSSARKRRSARTELSTIGPTSVKPLLDQYISPGASYRTRLGILVALTKMLQDNKDQRKPIADDILIQHRRLLLKDAGHKDRSLRNYASEFLFLLGDHRMVHPALDLIETGRLNDNDTNNLLLVIKGSIGDLAADGQKVADARLNALHNSLGKQNAVLVEQIVGSKKPDFEKKYWVVAGAFKSLERANLYVDIVNKIDPDFRAFAGEPIPNVPFYRVLVGDYAPRSDATATRDKLRQQKQLSGAFLTDYPYRR